MLYRAFYALPDSIKGADGKPVNALLGDAEPDPPGGRGARAARGRPLHRPGRCRPTGSSSTPPITPRAPRCPTASRPVRGRRPRLLRRLRLDRAATHDSLEADDLLGSFARLEVEAGGEALLLTGDRDMFQCASKQVTVLYVSTGQAGRAADRPGGGRAPVRDRAGAGAGLHRPARRSLRRPAGAKGVGEKTAAELLRKHGSLEGVLEAAIAETRPKLRVSLLGSRDELLAFKRIATLQDAKVKRPQDRPTDTPAARRRPRA